MEGLDELLEKLVEKVVFCEPPGLNFETFLTNLDTLLGFQVDDRFADKLWQWLSHHPDIRVDGHVATTTAAAAAAPSDHDTGTASRGILSASIDRIWQTVAGHPEDSQRVPSLEWDVLFLIAAAGPAGIKQNIIIHRTGQDKRSVPKRTDTLVAKGYVVKEEDVTERGYSATRCILRRFIDPERPLTLPRLHPNSTLATLHRQTSSVDGGDVDGDSPPPEADSSSLLHQRSADSAQAAITWTPETTLARAIVKLIDDAGVGGIVTNDVVLRIGGPSFTRPVEETLHLLVESAMVSSSDGSLTSCIVQDSVIINKSGNLRYHTLRHFQEAVRCGLASWDTATTRAPDVTSFNDPLGFPIMDKSRLAHTSGASVSVARAEVKDSRLRDPVMETKTPKYRQAPANANDVDVWAGSLRDVLVCASLTSLATPFDSRSIKHARSASDTDIPPTKRPRVSQSEDEAAGPPKALPAAILSLKEAAMSTTKRDKAWLLQTRILAERRLTALDQSVTNILQSHEAIDPAKAVESLETLQEQFFNLELPAMYIHPPLRVLHHGVSRGRPRKGLLCVFKSDKLHAFDWFTAEQNSSKPYKPLHGRNRREAIGLDEHRRKARPIGDKPPTASKKRKLVPSSGDNDAEEESLRPRKQSGPGRRSNLERDGFMVASSPGSLPIIQTDDCVVEVNRREHVDRDPVSMGTTPATNMLNERRQESLLNGSRPSDHRASDGYNEAAKNLDVNIVTRPSPVRVDSAHPSLHLESPRSPMLSNHLSAQLGTTIDSRLDDQYQIQASSVPEPYLTSSYSSGKNLQVPPCQSSEASRMSSDLEKIQGLDTLPSNDDCELHPSTAVHPRVSDTQSQSTQAEQQPLPTPGTLSRSEVAPEPAPVTLTFSYARRLGRLPQKTRAPTPPQVELSSQSTPQPNLMLDRRPASRRKPAARHLQQLSKVSLNPEAWQIRLSLADSDIPRPQPAYCSSHPWDLIAVVWPVVDSPQSRAYLGKDTQVSTVIERDTDIDGIMNLEGTKSKPPVWKNSTVSKMFHYALFVTLTDPDIQFSPSNGTFATNMTVVRSVIESPKLDLEDLMLFDAHTPRDTTQVIKTHIPGITDDALAKKIRRDPFFEIDQLQKWEKDHPNSLTGNVAVSHRRFFNIFVEPSLASGVKWKRPWVKHLNRARESRATRVRLHSEQTASGSDAPLSAGRTSKRKARGGRGSRANRRDKRQRLNKDSARPQEEDDPDHDSEPDGMGHPSEQVPFAHSQPVMDEPMHASNTSGDPQFSALIPSDLDQGQRHSEAQLHHPPSTKPQNMESGQIYQPNFLQSQQPYLPFGHSHFSPLQFVHETGYAHHLPLPIHGPDVSSHPSAPFHHQTYAISQLPAPLEVVQAQPSPYRFRKPRRRKSKQGLDLPNEGSASIQHPSHSRALSEAGPAEAQRTQSHASQANQQTPATVLQSNHPQAPGARTPSRPGKKVLDEDELADLLMTVVMIRTLVGGVDGVIDWTLVNDCFNYHGTYDTKSVKTRWEYQNKHHHDRVSKLTNLWQNAFLDAYGKGEVGPINFDAVDDINWSSLFKWTKSNVAPLWKAHRPTQKVPKKSYDVSGMNLDEIENAFTVAPFAEAWETSRSANIHSRFQSHTARDLAWTNDNWNDVLDSRADATSGTAADAGAEVAASWVRAFLLLPNVLKESREAKEKLSGLESASIDRAVHQLQQAKVLVNTKRKTPQLDSSVHVSDSFMKAMRSGFESVDTLRRAHAYKLALDERFAADDVVVYDPDCDTGDALACINLQHDGRLEAKSMIPPTTTELSNGGQSEAGGADRPALSVWGMRVTAHRGRGFDKDAIRFPLQLLPTPRYEYGTKASAVSVPAPHLTQESSGDVDKRIPVWYDLLGNLMPQVWTSLVESVMHKMVTRSSVSVDKLLQVFGTAGLTRHDVQLVLAWLAESGVARCREGQWSLSPGWWMVLGDAERSRGGGAAAAAAAATERGAEEGNARVDVGEGGRARSPGVEDQAMPGQADG